MYTLIATESGISRWWDAPKAVKDAEGTILEFRPGERHGVLRMRVLDLAPNRRVEWQCISTHPQSSPASAWTGTHVIFEISEKNGATILDFRHTGWDEASPYFGFCNYHWGEALQKLKQVCESGNSQPVAQAGTR